MSDRIDEEDFVQTFVWVVEALQWSFDQGPNPGNYSDELKKAIIYKDKLLSGEFKVVEL